MILLLVACVALVFAQTEVTVGSALVMSLQSGVDVDICPVKVVIPASRAGDKCSLEMRAILTGATSSGGLDLAFYWKKDSANFTETDKLAALTNTNIENKADCKTAGTYYIGLKVTKCTVCIAGVPASFDLDVAFRIDGVYQLDFDGEVNRQSAWLMSKANDYVYVNFAVKTKSTPHFNINKCAVTCLADNYDYYYGPQGTDFTNMASNRSMVTGDANNLVKLPMIEPGNYTFAVFIKMVTGGTNTQFRFQYSLNEKADTPYPNAVCPKTKCSATYNCPECSRNNCNWCEATRTCTPGACAGNDTAVTAEASCFKINDACTAIKACGDCADRLGCVWCNSLGGVGIDVGSCSAGKYDNGMECTSPLATALSERSKCPGESGKTTIVVNGTTGTAPKSAAGVQALSALVALTTVLVASL